MQLRSTISLLFILLLPLKYHLASSNNTVPVRFNPATYSVIGERNSVAVTLEALAEHDHSFTVIVATRDGSAIDGADYEGLRMNVNFPATSSNVSFNIVIHPNQAHSCPVDFFLDLEIPSAASAMGVVKASPGNATVLIADERSVPCQVTGVTLKPEPPMDGKVSMMVTWTAPRSYANISMYYVQYKENDTAFWGSQTVVAGSPPPTCSQLKGLKAGTPYDVRVQALSTAGEGPWSAVQTGRTYGGPSKITNVCVTKSEEEDGTLTVNMFWTPPQSDLPITEYEVEYQTRGMESWINATHLSVMPPANYTTLTGLDIATEYRIRVRALSEAGTGEWEVVLLEKTQYTVTNLSSNETVDSGTTTVTVTWTAPVTKGVHIFEYHVQYRERGKDEWINASAVTGSPPPTSITLTGLVPNTEYAIRVKSVPGIWSEELTVRTMNITSCHNNNSCTESPLSPSAPPLSITIWIGIASGLGIILCVLTIVCVVMLVVCLKRKQGRRKRVIMGDYVAQGNNNEYVTVGGTGVPNPATNEIEMTNRRALPARPPEAPSSDREYNNSSIESTPRMSPDRQSGTTRNDHEYYNSTMESTPRSSPERLSETRSTDHEYHNSSMESSRRSSSESLPEAPSNDHEYYNSTMDNLPFALPKSNNELDGSLFRVPVATASGIRAQMRQITRHSFELQSESVNLLQELGGGEFGMVYKGEWESSPRRRVQVAVKTLHSQEEENRYKLLKEAFIMGQFNHPNVVRFHGVIDRPNRVMLIMEYLARGDLLNHLIKCRSSSVHGKKLPVQLLKYCREIACAMEYLSKKGFIHRDLAARNILLTEGYVAKIADFGMSHDMNEDNYYKSKGGMIPVKWTAPEAVLYQTYTTKSDVWSYGMVMYEIWSLGHKPFEEFDINRVLRAFETGYCQPPPPGCPRSMYKLMVDCWNPDHHSRPTFEDLTSELATDPKALLSWSQQDKATSSKAAVLGAPLHEGRHLYPDLQQRY